MDGIAFFQKIASWPSLTISRSSDSPSFLDPTATVTGTLVVNGTLRLNGSFEGDLVSTDTVIIGDQAVVKGTVQARQVICRGRIDGQVVAEVELHLLPSAVVMGQIQTPSLNVEPGARLNGMCSTGDGASGQNLIPTPQQPLCLPRHHAPQPLPG